MIYHDGMSKYSIAIHGGAGALDDVSKYKDHIRDILQTVAKVAATGASALDVVEQAVTLLEDDDLFNAGKGSVLNVKGEVDCDAAIMDGRTLDAGAVAGVQGVKNPIQLSRKVMENSPHVMLIANGAREFADSQGFTTEPQAYFITEARKKQLEEAKAAGKIVLDHSDTKEEKLGTVGAVAIDAEGNLAAATSTGGIVNKQFGRIGDSPIVGAGVFAEHDLCAVSATGYGEQFIRTTVAKHIAEHMRYTKSDAMASAQAGIDFLVQEVAGLGGVIVVDKDYNIGFAHSTPVILAGSISDTEPEPKLFFS
jgi:beta-aspartyl-peptidase (threonine type)